MMVRLSQNRQLLIIYFSVQITILFTVYCINDRSKNAGVVEGKEKLNRSSLFDIGMKYNTDKVYSHRYETLYEKYLSKYRGESIRLLEIGLGCQMERGVGASARTWREYLGDKADIHFIEIDEKCGKDWENTIGGQVNVTVHYGSQEDIIFLEHIKSNLAPFDIIIDDGGHTMTQQKTSFITLLPLVRSGGIYVIEDLETSYNSVYANGSTTIALIKRFVDEIQSAFFQKTISHARRIFSFEVGDGICFFTVN